MKLPPPVKKAIVVLISATLHALKPERIRSIREVLNITPSLKALVPMVAGFR
jgi:hypothetical protein